MKIARTEYIMNRNSILLIVLLAFTTIVHADPIGTWEITMDGPQGKQVNLLTIRDEGGKHFATMAMPQGEVDVGELQVDGDHIEFTVAPVKDYPMMIFRYSADVDDNTMTGRVTTPRATIQFTGTRQ